MHIIDHPQAQIYLEPVGDKQRIRVEMKDPSAFISKNTWLTAYPLSLIETILAIKGPAWLCDEIMRDEDPSYLEEHLMVNIWGYQDDAAFQKTRLLEFGCGSAASTVLLAKRFPHLQIVGVELEADFLRIARARAAFYGLENVDFLLSPDGTRLPEGIGEFDFITLIAVYEHLLPQERRSLLPLLWSHLKPGGVLFLNETPQRYFPYEGHTTGLPFINYLPPALALWAARRFSPRIPAHLTWDDLLRMGIRGGTVGSVLADLGAADAQLLKPLHYANQIEMWYALSKPSGLKNLARQMMTGLHKLTGVELVPYIAIAIQKGL